jgi:hypothetical protein
MALNKDAAETKDVCEVDLVRPQPKCDSFLSVAKLNRWFFGDFASRFRLSLRARKVIVT